MNAAYVYDNHEAAFLIANRIYYLLEQKHWSVKTLSDESNIPYETLKKLLSRKTENTSFHNIMKIALAFQCNLNYLIEPLSTEPSSHAAQSLCTEIPVNNDAVFDIDDNISIGFTVPLMHLADLPDTPNNVSLTDTLDISSYPYPIRQEIACGIAVSSYCYHPVYSEKDILLVSRKRPPYPGETGIFFHSGELYIRIFLKSPDSVILRSVNGIGPDIQIFDFAEWIIGGYVVGVQKADHAIHF